MQEIINATEVRKEWGMFIDRVIHDKPELVKRNRDYFLSISLEHTMRLLDGYRFKAETLPENDGSITLALNDIDLVVNAPDLDTAKKELAAELIGYSKDFFKEFKTYYNAPNRNAHFPYVLKVVLMEDVDTIAELIDA